MSAERACFKKIDQLVEERNKYNNYFRASASELVTEALREFMGEHPEVKILRWEQNSENQIACMVKLDTRFVGHGDIAEPKLSGCVRALEEKFNSIKDVLILMFGNSMCVYVDHEKTFAVRA
jgi:hypothetical protein